ncbi:MAG: hypothetical protein AAGE96_06130 [Cyanobacteria bacterium P01_G01_bin.19]
MESAENQEQLPQVDRAQESEDSQSLSKVETIKLLNDSIDRLESTIKEISANSNPELPSSESIKTLLSTTKELADSVTVPAAEIGVKETPIPEEETIPSEAQPETVEPSPQVSVEPASPPSSESKSAPKKQVEKPSDRTVTDQKIIKDKKKKNKGSIVIGIIAVAIAIIAIAWLYLPQIKAAIAPQPAATEVIAQKNTSNTIEDEIARKSEAIEQIESNLDTNDVAVVDSQLKIDESIAENFANETSSDTIEEAPELVAIPQDLTSPGKVKSLQIETIEPEITFTPEQSLVAALQSQLAATIEAYDSDLFAKVNVDLAAKNLNIEVTDDWYTLGESRQTKLADKILKRSRQLDFSKLQIKDSMGILVARNPVVGDRIIILQSSKSD